MPQPKVRSNKLIVVDLETTCTNENAEQFSNEIIEIGLSIVDLKTLTVEKNISIMVKPQRSEVTDFCTKLTGITPEDVKDGLLLPDAALTLIKEYETDKYVWASWGDFDRLMVNREAKQYKARFPFNRQHLNLKALFGQVHGLDELVSLGTAVKMSGRVFEGRQHRGVDDARMTAQLYIDMLKKLRGV